MDNKLPDITLPAWMNKGEPLTLAHASKTWWERVREWLTFPLAQIDVDTCDERLLDLFAYQRDIERFEEEPLSLFRLRVKYAFINARDAGSVTGFIAIFDRLGVGRVTLRERQAGIDWDVITVELTDSQIADNPELLMQIIRKYGRTCRRYRFEVITTGNILMRAGWNLGDYVYYTAALQPNAATSTFSARLG